VFHLYSSRNIIKVGYVKAKYVDWTEYVLNVGSDMLKKCLPKYHIKDLGVGGNLKY